MQPLKACCKLITNVQATHTHTHTHTLTLPHTLPSLIPGYHPVGQAGITYQALQAIKHWVRATRQTLLQTIKYLRYWLSNLWYRVLYWFFQLKVKVNITMVIFSLRNELTYTIYILKHIKQFPISHPCKCQHFQDSR